MNTKKNKASMIHVKSDTRYDSGVILHVLKDFTMKDTFKLCKHLSSLPMYKGKCDFAPDNSSRGGFQFMYIVDYDKLDFPGYYNRMYWHKHVQFDLSGWIFDRKHPEIGCGEEYLRLSEWVEEYKRFKQYGCYYFADRVVIPKCSIIRVSLVCDGAPQFTKEELDVWKECFEKFGFKWTLK